MRCRLLLGLGLPALTALAGCGSGRSTATASQRKIPNGVTLTYAARPYGSPVTAEELRRTVGILTGRLRAIGVEGTLQIEGERILVTLPSSVGSVSRAERVARTAELYFYDWEPNVIGRDGKAAPTEASATGGPEAGAARFGLSEYQAVLRAAKRAAILRANDTTWAAGCTPQQRGSCPYGSWYLLDAAHRKVLGGPDESAAELGSAGAAAKRVRVNPGTVIVRARASESPPGKIIDSHPDRWYVLNDDAVLTGADITNPQTSVEGGRPPVVTFGFTPRGAPLFEHLTREVSRRGQEAELPGVAREDAQQHFAIVLDGRLIMVAAMDYTRYPEGINPSNGSEIAGGLTLRGARELTGLLGAASLPVRLRLVSRSRPPGR